MKLPASAVTFLGGVAGFVVAILGSLFWSWHQIAQIASPPGFCHEGKGGEACTMVLAFALPVVAFWALLFGVLGGVAGALIARFVHTRISN